MKKQGDKDKVIRKSRKNVDINKIISMYKSGSSCNEIAKHMNITAPAVRYRLIEQGLYQGRRGGFRIILNTIDELEEKIKEHKLNETEKKTIKDRLYNLIMSL